MSNILEKMNMIDKLKSAAFFVMGMAGVMGFSAWIGVGIGHGIVTGMRWAL